MKPATTRLNVRPCVPAMPQGKTYEEVMENIKDVIAMCLEELQAQGKKVPEQAEIIGVQRVEVTV